MDIFGLSVSMYMNLHIYCVLLIMDLSDLAANFTDLLFFVTAK